MGFLGDTFRAATGSNKRSTWTRDSTGHKKERWHVMTESTWRVEQQGVPPHYSAALYDNGRYVGHFLDFYIAQQYAEGRGREDQRQIRKRK